MMNCKLLMMFVSVVLTFVLGASAASFPMVSHGSFVPMETGVLKVTSEPDAPRTDVHFAPPAGIEDAEALAFDFYAADLGDCSTFDLRVISPTNVWSTYVSPDRAGVWNTVKVPVKRLSAVERVKLSVSRAVVGKPFVFYIGNLRAIRTAKSVAKPGERRFGWVLAHAKDGHDDWEATAAFFEKCGFTDMIALVARGGCAYYDSKVLPRAKGLKEGLSSARAAIEACHRHGLKCHLWKTCWQVRDDTPKDFLKQLTSENRFQTNDKGKVDKGWLCPSDERNRAAEIAVMKEFAELGADGVHFDYIRFNGEKGCFCPRCRDAFSRQNGVKWNDFRAELISTLVRDVAAFAHAHSPRIEVSAAVFRDPEADRAKLAQDWGRWCREGWLDIVCPMNYDWSPDVYRGIIRRQKEALKGCKVQYCPGIGLTCNRWKLMPEDLFREEVAIVRECEAAGFSVFHIGKAADESLAQAFDSVHQ